MKKVKDKRQQQALNIFLGIIFLTLPIIGIALSAIAIGSDIGNYVEPYKFCFIWGVIGVVLAYMVTYKLKPIIMTVNKNIKNYSQLRLYFSLGFIGIALIVGVKINSYNSSLDKTFNSTLIYKTQKKGGYGVVGYNKLHFFINEQAIELRCHLKYWENHNLGEKINIEFYKSKMGFHYWKIKNE